ncbi:MAG TPA: sigma-54 dependent transcriptional regulator [Verrucomicrobiae bacterium]|nr:sigma-54 dependent transcriptional regulator [Verrucomicrobiae bacterium]
MKPNILIVDDEKNAWEGLRAALEDKYEVYVAADSAQALNILESERIDLMLTDMKMPGEEGLDLIERALALPHKPVCLLMTAYGSVETAVEAMKKGATDYLAKPLNLDEVELIVAHHLKARRLESENLELRQKVAEREGMEEIIGRSSPMVEVLDVVKQVAPSRATVLIQGESGTGKELVARAIHRLSPRREGPMVTVHCAALSPQLLESELFGHEKGSFTGAVERRIGRFEAAEGGTIFLDEIGEIDPGTQVKVLRVLGERSFERVGSTKTLHVDVRLVAATNKDLRKLVDEGKFRDDLFFRLNVVPIQMPPLRERPEDIPLLVRAFLAEFNRENGANVKGFSREAMERLLAYHWPGNVRELRTAVEHAVVLCRGEEAGLRELPSAVRGAETGAPGGGARGGEELSWEDSEKRLIIKALEQTGGNRAEAARRMGMSRRTLHRKLNQYGLVQVGRPRRREGRN